MSARTATTKGAAPKSAPGPNEALHLARRHFRAGWWSLLAFLTLGIFLEALHGFKIGWYLDVSNAPRRSMLTLSHAHGTLLSLLHIAFAAAVLHLAAWEPRTRRWAANCLVGAGVLIPAGFFLGGLALDAGDPGLGIVLVPVGALLLAACVLLTAREFKKSRPRAE
jgi:hypothetical protein